MPVAIADRTAFAAGDGYSVVLLAPAIAQNSPPSGATAGLSTAELFNCFTSWPLACTLSIFSTAGSGTMTATCRLWGYVPNSTGTGIWVPCGPGADSTKGTLNLTAAIGETGADTLRHSETIDLPGHFQRLYCEVVAIGGSATSITAELIVRRGYPS